MATESPAAAPKTVSIQRFQIGLNVLIQVVVVTLIIAMLNYLSFRHFKRWDYSRDKKFALSSQTNNLLAHLKKPVRAVIFFSGATEIVPDLQALMREYEFASKKKFTAEYVDPYRSLTRAQELQTKYKFGANESILILDYDSRSKFVNAGDMVDVEQPDQMAMMAGQTQPRIKAFKGEQAITSALLELTEGKPNKVYLVGGHGEPDIKSPDLKLFAESLQRQNIEAATLNLLNVTAIPEDARSLIICGPKYDFSEVEVKLLNGFWEKKGRVFVLLNPFARTPRLTAWLKQVVGQMTSDEAVQFVHSDRAAFADRFSFSRLRHARVVAMHIAGPRRTGAQRHAATTRGTDGQAGQQNWPIDHAWSHNARAALPEGCLHALEYCRCDDRRYIAIDKFCRRLHAAGLLLDPVEAHPACVDGVGQQGMNLPDTPAGPAPRPVAPCI